MLMSTPLSVVLIVGSARCLVSCDPCIFYRSVLTRNSQKLHFHAESCGIIVNLFPLKGPRRGPSKPFELLTEQDFEVGAPERQINTYI